MLISRVSLGPRRLGQKCALHAFAPMPVVSVIRHKRGLDFTTESQVVRLRDDKKLSWEIIAGMVWNLEGEHPSPNKVRETYACFSKSKARCQYKFAKCGRKRWVLTKPSQNWIVRRLLQIRKSTVCTSATLQEHLAKEKGVAVSDSAIRKLLKSRGYAWRPRAQKRLFSTEDRKDRMRFAKAVLRMTKADLRKKFSFSMDGAVIPRPPEDPTDRLNFCRQGETHMYRKKNERAHPLLSGDNPYAAQVPLNRCVALWGGISEGGFATVVIHPKKKLTTAEWIECVRDGTLTSAIKSLKPVNKRGPWHVLGDNEKFLKADASYAAYRAMKVKLWLVPARSPDLNPVEKFWSWRRRELRRRDLKDLCEGRPVLGKMAYRLRIQAVVRTAKAKTVAANCAGTLRKVCKKVVKNRGAHSGY